MFLDSNLDFSHKQVKVTIIPPMTYEGPICSRKYTIFFAPVTCEYFLTVGNEYFKENANPIFTDTVFGKWQKNDCDIYMLKLYVNLGDENNLAVFARYALFKQLLPNYIRTVIYGDREFFRHNRCLLDCQVFVKFTSGCEVFNSIESYGSLKHYSKKC